MPGTKYRGNYSTTLYRDLATDAIKRHAAAMRGRDHTTTEDASPLSSQDSEYDSAIRPMFMWVAFHAVHRDDSSTPPDDAFSGLQQAYLTKLEQV